MQCKDIVCKQQTNIIIKDLNIKNSKFSSIAAKPQINLIFLFAYNAMKNIKILAIIIVVIFQLIFIM